MATTSVTLRIPNEILDQLPKARGERSRAIVELLRKGMSLPSEKDILQALEDRIGKLEAEVLILKNSESPKTGSSKPDTKKKEIPKKILEAVEASRKEASRKKEHGLPEKSQKMNTGELLNILKKEAPEKRWASNSLDKYKSNRNADKWHIVGKCKFRFSGEREKGKSTQKQQWLYWVLYPFTQEG